VADGLTPTVVNERIELLSAIHWKIVPPFAPEIDNLHAQVDLLGRCIAAQVATIEPREAVLAADYMLSSTVISGAITGNPAVAGRLFDSMEAHCGARPLAFLHTYMCSGWGYALRYFSHHTDSRLVMLSIVDVDVHNLQYHLSHPQLGQLGFGISTLLLSLPDSRVETAVTGGPYPDSAFKEFIRALRKHNAARRPAMTFVPFFRPSLAAIVTNTLGKLAVGENRHELDGHCFGSDPWIGIITWLQKYPLHAPVNITAGAVALNGYYTLCDVGLSPRTLMSYREARGSAGDLEAAIRDARMQAVSCA
jgi:hypothetical protein